MVNILIEQPSESDLDVIHGLVTESYWSPGIPRDRVERAWRNSLCALARDEAGSLIAFGRVISDRATFAWLCDVMVVPAHQGRGIARALVRRLQAHPELADLPRWFLGTRDAHGVYAPLGFTPVARPERLMQIRHPSPYGRQTG